jgi:hypothetical protein
MVARWMIVLGFGIGGVGCALEETDPPQTGEADQDLSGFVQLGLNTCSSPGGCRYAMGPIQFGRACFVSGIAGDLSFGSVQFTNDGTTEFMVIIPGPNRTLSAAGACVTPGLNLATSGTWYSSQGSISLGGGSDRQCVISGIVNTNGLESPSDTVQVWHGTFGWELGGTVAPGHYMSASATCWDGSAFQGGVGNFNFNTVKPLDYSPGADGMVCAPTELAGNFTTTTAKAQSYFNARNGSWNLDVAYAGAATSCFI